MSVASAARVTATFLMWVLTTILLTAAVPAMWAQQHLVSRTGYAALAQRAAADPALQSSMATELTAQVGRLGGGVDDTLVNGIARTYTASSSFPAQFGQANAFAHRWLFTDSVGSSVDAQGRWVIDIGPMLSDAAFAQTLRDYNIQVPESVPIPLTDNAPAALRPGVLSAYGTWAPAVSGGLVAVAAGAALLTLFAARRRGKALAALGVSALVAAGAGWVGMVYAQRRMSAAMPAEVSLRAVADAMVAAARASLGEWLTVTAAIGGGVVIVGVIASLLGGVDASRRGRPQHPVQERERQR